MRRGIFRFASGLFLCFLVPACGGHSGGDSFVPVAPVISSFLLTPEFAYLNSGNGTVDVDGSFDFEDPNGDLRFLTLTILNSSGEVLDTGTIPLEGADGITSGYVNFEGWLSTTTVETYTLRVHVTDARHLASNELTDTIRITPDPWVPKAAMPLPRWRCSAVVLNGLIYVMGGLGPDDPAPVQIYNPAIDAWTTGAPTPIVGSVPLAAVSGKIYLFGTSTIYVYDPDLDSWSQRECPLLPYSGSGVAALNGRIYLLGGYFNAGRTTTVWIYEPATDTWSYGAPVPSVDVDPFAATAGGKIYLRGGSWIYDPASDSWSPGFGPPPPPGPYGWVGVGNTIYGIGGEYYTRVVACDLSTGAWTLKTSAPVPLPDATAVELNGRIYVLAVVQGSPAYYNATAEYTPSNDPR